MIKLIGEKLWQYDLGRTVELIPRDGHTIEVVRFCRGLETLTVAHREENGKIVADIPNILLKAFGTIVVECQLNDKDGCHIREHATFYVDNRKMPDGYEYVETPVLELGSGGGGSWNDLTDKPFYTENQMVEVLAETNLALDGDGMSGIEAVLVKNGTYYIKWNGTEYTCVAQDMSAFVEGAVGLGDLSTFGGSGNGEPFAMAYMPGNGTQVMALDGTVNASVSVSVRHLAEIVHILDGKYLDAEAVKTITAPEIETAKSEAVEEATEVVNTALEAHTAESEIPVIDLRNFIDKLEIGNDYTELQFGTATEWSAHHEKICKTGAVKVLFWFNSSADYVIAHPMLSELVAYNQSVYITFTLPIIGAEPTEIAMVIITTNNSGTMNVYTRRIALTE